MANYYTQMSIELKPSSEWDIRDIDRILLAIEEENLEQAPEWYQADHQSIQEGIEFSTYIENYLEGSGSINHTISDSGLWIYSEESANITHIVHAIHQTMNHYNTPGYVAFEWSYSASKPMLDAFGGGAVFISAEECLYHTTGNWLWETIKAHPDQQQESRNETR